MAEWVSVLAFLFALVTVFALERLMPRSRPPSARTMLSDSVYLVMAAVVQRVVVGLLSTVWLGITVWLGSLAATSGDVPLAERVLAGASALLLADLAKYWLHRISHEHPGWWRFHAAHHAPRRVYSLNGVRIHPVNLAWNLAADTLAALALGLDGATLALVASFRGVVAVLQHADLELNFKGLNCVFSTPDLHRFHHSTTQSEGNTNYGSTFIVWDVVFGTRYLRAGAPAEFGLSGNPSHPEPFFAMLLWPWRKQSAGAPAGEVKGRA